ncbi:hypothetical protein ACSBL2_14640 [Pedobacter sp. AW31-3R]|uniref:hypothetical protein n=1 Tax=Pedobacter sp. AW31-3R TaxID=3445781 RepID=UPI003FA111E9
MKNLFKFGFLALAISLSVAACGGSDKPADTDSTATDTTLTTVDTTVTDTAVVADTTVADTTKL